MTDLAAHNSIGNGTCLMLLLVFLYTTAKIASDSEAIETVIKLLL